VDRAEMRPQGRSKSHPGELVRRQDSGRGASPVFGPMGVGLHDSAGVGGQHTAQEPWGGNMEGNGHNGVARGDSSTQSFVYNDEPERRI